MKYNLDIIEFSVLHQIEGNDNIFFPKLHIANHYHNFGKKIIFQPELSNILYIFQGQNNIAEQYVEIFGIK